MSLRRILAVSVAVTGAMAGGLVAGAGQAQAADPQCNAAVRLPWTGISMPAYKSTTTSLSCEMWQGHTGDKVRVLQQSLRYCNGENIAVDSHYGPATAAAVKRINGVNGIYGRHTRDMMRWMDYKSNGGYTCVQVP